MTALEHHVENYVAVRRGLGFKLTHEQRMLNRYVAFMDGAGASTLTVDLSMSSAKQSLATPPKSPTFQSSYPRRTRSSSSAVNPHAPPASGEDRTRAQAPVLRAGG
jgi:hypothetical protein